jgi:hypothetical protein
MSTAVHWPSISITITQSTISIPHNRTELHLSTPNLPEARTGVARSGGPHQIFCPAELKQEGRKIKVGKGDCLFKRSSTASSARLSSSRRMISPRRMAKMRGPSSHRKGLPASELAIFISSTALRSRSSSSVDQRKRAITTAAHVVRPPKTPNNKNKNKKNNARSNGSIDYMMGLVIEASL